MTSSVILKNDITKSRSDLEREYQIKKFLKEDGSRLKDLSGDIKNNEDYVTEAVLNDGTALQYASLRLRSSSKFACKLLTQVPNSSSFGFFEKNIRDDISVASTFLIRFGQEFWKLPPEIINNKEFAKKAINAFPDNFRWCSEELRNDTDFVREMARNHPATFSHASHRLRDDSGFVLSLITGKTTAEVSVVKYASDRLRKDPDFAIKVMQFNPVALGFLAKEARKSVEISEILLQKSPTYMNLLDTDELFKPELIVKFFKKAPIDTFQFLQFNETSKEHPEIITNFTSLLSKSPKDCAVVFNRLAGDKTSCTEMGDEQQSEFYSKNVKMFDWFMPFLTDAFLKQRNGIRNSFIRKTVSDEVFRRSVLSIDFKQPSETQKQVKRTRKIKP